MEEIKQNGTSGSILDDGYYGNLLRGGGNTDSDWDILVAGKRAPKKKKASPRKPPSRLDRVKTNIPKTPKPRIWFMISYINCKIYQNE